MALGPPSESVLPGVEEPQACSECHSISRLTNGLCLNCLLRGALNDEDARSGKDAFKEVLSSVQARDGDWHIADHEILDEIARGGMGVVYAAREPHSGRVVALKCVLAYQGDSDHALARFRREAETAARLDHPNIVPIYQIGETADGFPYYTMKYATAGSLMQARVPLVQHPRQSVELMLKVARAVQYAHEKGVLHRDLKPANILLDDRGEPLVGDFGLARSETASNFLTRSLGSLGTPGYIAPEQADGPAANLTPAADIYSLGAILFELLTGRLPFLGDNAFAVMKQAAEEPAPKVRSFAPRVDRDLETICARCLEREPIDRYQSAAAFASDLENWLQGNPISAGPIRPWRQARRWIERHRGLVGVAAALIVAGAVIMGWFIHRQLQLAVRESVLAARSSIVLPILDLDEVRRDSSVAHSIATSLERRLSSDGPVRIEVADPDDVSDLSSIDTIRVGGKKTNARTVVTGTMRTVPGGKRISLRLLNSNNELLFSKVWVAAGGDTEVSAEVAEEFYRILSAPDWSAIAEARSDPGYRNPEARESITAGRSLLARVSTAAECDQAIALFRKAVEKAPDSVVAHANLSFAAAGRAYYNADESFIALAEKEADKAVALAPDSGEAHRAKAGVYFQQGRFPEVLEEQLRSIESGGLDEKLANVVGRTLDMLGRPHHALKWGQLRLRTPRNPGDVERLLGDCWLKLVEDEKALAAYQRASDLRPDMPQGALGISLVHLYQGDFVAAREAWDTYRRRVFYPGETDQVAAQIEFFSRNFAKAQERYEVLARNDPDGGGGSWGAITYRSAIARIKQERGETAEATKLLNLGLARESEISARQPANPEAAYRLAAVQAMLGQADDALQNLRRAFDLGWIDYRSLNLDPRFDLLRSHPEFERITTAISNSVRAMKVEAQKASSSYHHEK